MLGAVSLQEPASKSVLVLSSVCRGRASGPSRSIVTSATCAPGRGPRDEGLAGFGFLLGERRFELSHLLAVCAPRRLGATRPGPVRTRRAGAACHVGLPIGGGCRSSARGAPGLGPGTMLRRHDRIFQTKRRPPGLPHHMVTSRRPSGTNERATRMPLVAGGLPVIGGGHSLSFHRPPTPIRLARGVPNPAGRIGAALSGTAASVRADRVRARRGVASCNGEVAEVAVGGSEPLDPRGPQSPLCHGRARPFQRQDQPHDYAHVFAEAQLATAQPMVDAIMEARWGVRNTCATSAPRRLRQAAPNA